MAYAWFPTRTLHLLDLTAPTFARALDDLADAWQHTLRNACAHLTYTYA